MPLPEHKSPTQINRSATAPYNFVPLSERLVKAAESPDKLPKHDRYQNFSGYFDVILTTRSPLYIRGPLTKQMFDRSEQNQDRNGNPENRQTPYANRIKNIPDFFHTRRDNNDPGAPVIPGSSLRGMLRAMIEIISHGKFTRVTERQLIYRAVGDTTSLGAWYRQQILGANQASGTPNEIKLDYPLKGQVKGGYLEQSNGDWYIRPAKEFHGESIVHVEYTVADSIHIPRTPQRVHTVYLVPPRRTWDTRSPRDGKTLSLNLAVVGNRSEISRTPAPRMETAKLVVSGHMGGKHEKHMHCAIYETDGSATPITISPALWQLYQEDLALPRGNLPTRPLVVDSPVFYLLDSTGALVYFGSTMMFRLPYQKTIHDRIPENLRAALALDYADALFGYVRQPKDFEGRKDAEGNPIPRPTQGDKGNAYSGRVSVTDAVLDGVKQPGQLYWQGHPITPKILASPKPTCFQHYLVQDRPDRKETLSHYDSPTEDHTGQKQGTQEPVIRGHKRYWHHREVTLNSVTGRDDNNGQDRGQEPPATSTQHTRIKPLNTGVRFKFRIHFENLSEKELGALCWALQPLGDLNRTYCHALGMGKSLGLGKIILSSHLYLIKERKDRYSALFSSTEEGWGDGISASWRLDELAHKLDALATQNRPAQESTPESFAQAFEQDILKGIESPKRRLKELPRIQALLRLLEDNGPGDTHLETMSPQTFRNRPVLPNALEVGQERATAPSSRTNPGRAAHSGRTSGDNRPRQGPVASSPMRTAPAVRLDNDQTDGMKLARLWIENFRGAQDFSRMPEFIDKIKRVEDKAQQRALAEEWRSKAKKLKLDLKKQADKPWFNALQALLAEDS